MMTSSIFTVTMKRGFLCYFCQCMVLWTITIVSGESLDSIPLPLTIVLEPVPLDWQRIVEGGNNTTTTPRTYFHVTSPTPVEESCQNSTYCWNKISLDISATNKIEFIFKTSSSSSGKEMKLISNPDIPIISFFKMKSFSCLKENPYGQIIFSANIGVDLIGSNYQPLISSMDSIRSYIEFKKQCGLESQLQFQPLQNSSISKLTWHSSYSTTPLTNGILPYTLNLEDLYIQGLDWHRQDNSKINDTPPTPSPFPDPGKPTSKSNTFTVQSNYNFLIILSCFFVVFVIH